MIRYRQVQVIISFLLLACPLAAQDSWTRFRGPQANGHAVAGSNPPVSWSKDNNIAWRSEIPGEGWSSPVVQDGRIYLSAAITNDDDDFDLSLVIVDAKSGELLKTSKLLTQKSADTPKIHKKNSHASPTPIISGDRIYVHFGYQGTVCADLSGNLIWQNRDLYFSPVHGNGGSPILVDGKLIFTCDGAKNPKVVALDANNGQLAWQTPRPVDAKKKFSFATPTLIEVDGQQQVIAPGSDCVLALDPGTGDIIWEANYSGYSVVPKPIYESAVVLLSTGFDKAKLLAIRPQGRGDITDTHIQWEIDRNISKTPSMIAHAGLLYCVSDNGIAQCIDIGTGDVLYQERLGGNFSASPTFAGDRIYFTSESGVTTVIKAGEVFEKIAENDLQERTLASMAIIGDAIIMRTADALYRIEE